MSTAHIIGKYNATPPSLSDGQTVQVRVTSTGALVTDGAGTITSVVPGTGATNLGKAEDSPHASGDVGVEMLAVRTDTPASSGANGDYVTVNSDNLGHLWAREGYAPQYEDNTNGVGAMVIKPLAVSTYSPTLFTNFGANATLNVKATPGNVYSLYCDNLNAAVRYLQLHNTATTPAGGAVPLMTFKIPATSTLVLGTDFFTLAGENFSTGIAFAFSTTEGTYTAGAAADQFTQIQYK